MSSYPTPYPEVNSILDSLLSNVRSILGDYFVGMYLYGSLASGDFNPLSSDIDFVVVTTTELPAEKVASLETFHRQLAAGGSAWVVNKWTTKLEGAYVPQSAIRWPVADSRTYPILNEGRFYLSDLGSDWIIQRHVIREYGVIVAGPEPRPLIDPVSAADLRGAVKGIMREWWAPMLDNPDWLRRTGYLAFAVLSMCRVLHALEHGTIASKAVAARWAIEAYHSWAELVEWALIQPDATQYERLADVLAFIRFTVEKGDIL